MSTQNPINDDQPSTTPTENDYRYCPMCRTELVVRPLFGRDRQQCPACNWNHFKDPKVGAGVLAEQDGKILLGRRGVNPGMGLWCLPSGFVDSDETPEETAIREYAEETGLEVVLTGLFDLYSYVSAAKGGGILILYWGEIVGGQARPMDDIVEIGLFTPADLPPDDQIAFESNRQALQRWQAEKLAEQSRGY
jgi:ADP-ribose pyrophosphatase YjhB (NUDIX family)